MQKHFKLIQCWRRIIQNQLDIISELYTESLKPVMCEIQTEELI